MSDPARVVAMLQEAVNAHDLDAVAALAPGNERFRESHRRLLTAFPDVGIDFEWSIAEADKCAAWAHIHGTHQGDWRGIAPTGRPIDVHGVMVLQVDEHDVVTDFWLVNDWLTIALQIGATLTPPA